MSIPGVTWGLPWPSSCSQQPGLGPASSSAPHSYPPACSRTHGSSSRQGPGDGHAYWGQRTHKGRNSTGDLRHFGKQIEGQHGKGWLRPCGQGCPPTQGRDYPPQKPGLTWRQTRDFSSRYCSILAPSMAPRLLKWMSTYLPKRLELSLRMVLAFPNAAE